jgi:hypothetical protein
MDTYEIYGEVYSLDYKNKEFTIKVFDEDKNEYIYECKCNTFCPLEKNDIVYGIVKSVKGKLEFISQPLVQIAIKKKHISDLIEKFLKDIPKKIITDLIKKISSINSDIDKFLDEITIDFIKNNKIHYLFEFLEKENSSKFFKNWYSKRILRKIYLFGLTNKEIKQSNIPELELYEICKTDPYKIYSIDNKKLNNILTTLKLETDYLENMCSNVIKKIYELREKNGFISVPFTYLNNKFKNLYQLKQKLIDDYGIVFEDGEVYLKYNYLVEETVCKFINEKILQTAINFGSNNQFEQNHEFMCKTLSEDQMKAINGVLTNDISIITGGPGCGKCLDPNTEILMFDCSIKKIKDIIPGELIMGDDSKYRKVLSVCNGYNHMFEIIPIYGKSFVCNEPHILTLKGLIPKIYSDYSNQSVVYTIKGIKKEKKFRSIDKCNKFINSLEEDIYDISLYEYMKGNHIGFVYHQNIEFDKIELFDTPYNIGLNINNFENIDKNILYNSYTNRLLFLAGVLDKLGKIGINLLDKNHIVKLNDCSLDFLIDLNFLTLSIGIFSFIDNNELILMDELCIIPTNILKLYDFKTKMDRLPFSIKKKPFGLNRYSGFELSGNGRFLLSNLMVTHNTTIIGEIINILQKNNFKYVCASYTGKAIMRLKEIINKFQEKIGENVCFTLDKLIKINFETFDYLILDEASMITTELFYRFILKYSFNYKIIIIGDINQLQPVSWGYLMKQLIDCKRIPIYRLTKNFRTSDNIILENSNKIVDKYRDLSYPIKFKDGSGFSYLDGDIEIIEIILNGLKNNEIEPSKITIICPFNEHIDILNSIFQNIFLKDKESIYDITTNKNWYIGDKVMMLFNNYEINVMNGEEGIISSIKTEGIFVKFKETEFLFKFDETNDIFKKKYEDDEKHISELSTKCINHSSAITIHKSQGSENDFIIVYIPFKENTTFLNCNLLYTALTRTKTYVWLVGSKQIIINMCSKYQKIRKEKLNVKLNKLYDSSIENVLDNLTHEENDKEEIEDDEEFFDFE